MANIGLYYNNILETTVSILPEQINSELNNNILKNLKHKIEGKSTEYGVEMKVLRIIDYNYGMIDKTNFMGTTIYKVKYECFVCSPIKDIEFICQIDIYNLWL